MFDRLMSSDPRRLGKQSYPLVGLFSPSGLRSDRSGLIGDVAGAAVDALKPSDVHVHSDMLDLGGFPLRQVGAGRGVGGGPWQRVPCTCLCGGVM